MTAKRVDSTSSLEEWGKIILGTRGGRLSTEDICCADPVPCRYSSTRQPGSGYRGQGAVMLIARCPGLESDMLLTAAQGLLPEEAAARIFNSWVVACPCPEVFQPVQAEVQACRPRLMQEIRRLSPSFVIAAGSHAVNAVSVMASLGPVPNMSEIVGNPVPAAFGDRKTIFLPIPGPMLWDEEIVDDSFLSEFSRGIESLKVMGYWELAFPTFASPDLF